jgi:hypothetical protein
MTKPLATLNWFKVNGRHRQRLETHFFHEDALPFPGAKDDRAPEFLDTLLSLWS